MNGNGSSERHQNNNLNVLIEFSNYYDSNTTFYDINKKEQILSFLDTKIKSKGLLERLIPLRSLPGQPQFDISEVVNDAGDEQFKEL